MPLGSRTTSWVIATSAAAMFWLAACGQEPEAVDDECGGSARFAASGSCGGVTPLVPTFGPSVDALASYASQTTCDPTEKPGVVAFKDLILSTYGCTTSYGITRACSSGGTSEHKEGRAWDWAVTPSNPAAMDLLNWLLAPDAYGNQYAMLRRFGIMYMIFNKKIWSAYKADQGWRAYTGSNPHTDHVHFSFSWEGANKQTSYYSSGGSTTPPPPPPPPPPTTTPDQGAYPGAYPDSTVDAGGYPDAYVPPPTQPTVPTTPGPEQPNTGAGWPPPNTPTQPQPAPHLRGTCALAPGPLAPPSLGLVAGLLLIVALRRRRRRRR
ncbi:MAG: hypothetical protein KC503_13245 [Myxococcales bacterium]|nr:hypothetical protein [Myxococcales bacterium]